MKCKADDFCLYAVTDRQWLIDTDLSKEVEQAILGGVTFVQLREKNMSQDAFRDLARSVKGITDVHGIPFVINDSISIALEVDADGVHLGQKDLSIQQARQQLGHGKIIGISTHTVQEAIDAEKNGADYIGVGAVFPTSTKTDASPLPKSLVKAITKAVNIPVVAIGGIQLNNLSYLEGTGISGIAVVSALFASGDTHQAATTLKKAVTELTQNVRQSGAP